MGWRNRFVFKVDCAGAVVVCAELFVGIRDDCSDGNGMRELAVQLELDLIVECLFDRARRIGWIEDLCEIDLFLGAVFLISLRLLCFRPAARPMFL